MSKFCEYFVFILMPPKTVEHFRGISNKTNQAQQCVFLANWAPCFIDCKIRHFVIKSWFLDKNKGFSKF